MKKITTFGLIMSCMFMVSLHAKELPVSNIDTSICPATEEIAAMYALSLAVDKTKDNESYGGIIVRRDNCFYYTNPVMIIDHNKSEFNVNSIMDTVVATYQTKDKFERKKDIFVRNDIERLEQDNIVSYVASADTCEVRKLDDDSYHRTLPQADIGANKPVLEGRVSFRLGHVCYRREHIVMNDTE